MIVFENAGEIDPQAIALIGVNVKEGASPIGFFGTGLKYAVASMVRWGELMVVQSGEAEFAFSSEKVEVRGKAFEAIVMRSRVDALRLGFTTELGKAWHPWMIYRELWCNAHDEPEPKVYEVGRPPTPKAGTTRVVVSGPRIEGAHDGRRAFILGDSRKLLHATPGVDVYEGPGERIFYRGIAVQEPSKPGKFTYNIKSALYLTEDRTAGSWATDPIIARGLASLEGEEAIEATLTAPSGALESRLDYEYATDPSPTWERVARRLAEERPLDVPKSVRDRFASKAEARLCPACGRPIDAADKKGNDEPAF